MLQIRKAWVSHREKKAAFRCEGSQDVEGEPTEVQDRTALARGTIGMGGSGKNWEHFQICLLRIHLSLADGSYFLGHLP